MDIIENDNFLQLRTESQPRRGSAAYVNVSNEEEEKGCSKLSLVGGGEDSGEFGTG